VILQKAEPRGFAFFFWREVIAHLRIARSGTILALMVSNLESAHLSSKRSITLSKPISKTAQPSINVTPLIDVLLVLLIIFMVIQPQKEMKLPVRAPQPAPDAPPRPGMLMLTVSTSAELQLNTHPIRIDELGLKLVALMEERQSDDRALFIKAPSALPYPFIVRLVDMAKRSGVISVGLLTDEEKIPDASGAS